jgi:hypothetical protein
MSKGRDKPSVIDFWNIEHSPRKWIWKIQYRAGVLQHRYRCNCKYRTLLLHFECWFTVQLLKVFFSHTVLHSRNALLSNTVLHSETYTYSCTELLHFLDLVYGIGNIVLNWLSDNIDMHFVICTYFSQHSSIILGFLI